MEEQVDKLGGVMREVAAAQQAALAQRSVLEQVRVRGPLRRPPARLPRLRLILPTLAVAGAAVLWFGRHQLELVRPDPVSFAVDGAATGAAPTGRLDELVQAPPDRPVPLAFSDGSRVTLNGGARLQVAELDARGATLRLESGSAEVDVHHRANARWRLRAGAFEVTVTGTRFTIEWEAAAEALTVVMSQGSVAVRGPGVDSASPVVVSAGQRFRASAREVGWTLAAASVAGAPPVEMPAPPVEAPAEAPARSEAAAPSARASNWAALARAGRYPEALRAVERTGFERACRTMGADELIQLGDAARLARNPARAEAAYRAARQRFPANDRPAFALGLVAFEQRRDYQAAATWFELYVRQYPGGPLAREAAGRALESWHRAGDGARARRAARNYLQQMPEGPYAPLARQLAAP